MPILMETGICRLLGSNWLCDGIYFSSIIAY